MIGTVIIVENPGMEKFKLLYFQNDLMMGLTELIEIKFNKILMV